MPTEMRLDVHDINNTSSPIDSLSDETYGKAMNAALTGTGGSLTFTNDLDTDDIGLLEPRRVIRVHTKDSGDAWQLREAYVVNGRDLWVPEDGGGPVAQIVTCSHLKTWLGYERGGGLLHPKIDLALRRNPREFSFRDLGADTSDWVEPDNQGRWRSPSNPDARGKPVGWPDQDDGQWIGHEQDFGVYRRELDLAAVPEKKRPTWLFASGQADWRLFVDGKLFLQGGPYDVGKRRYEWHRDLHVITLECEDGPIIFASTAIEPGGAVGGILYRSFTTDVFGTGDPHPWRTGPTRGVTRGYIEGTALQESKDRGELPNVTAGFTATHDSNNQEWQDTIIHAFRLQTLGRLDDDVGALLPGDSWMTPTGTFHIAQRRGTDRSGTVTVVPTFGGRVRREAPRLTRGLFETPDGYGIIPPEAAAEAQYGIMADMLTYGTGLRPDNLEAAVLHDIRTMSAEGIDAQVEMPDNVRPYEDCFLGDTVRLVVGPVDIPARISTFELADDPSTGMPEWAASVIPDE